MNTVNQQQNKNKFYIYKVYHNEEIIYVGKGQGNRYQHVLSGASHNKHLNKLYYECLRESTSFPEVILEYCDSEEESVDKEHHLIYTLKPRYNTQLKYTPPKSYNFEEEFLVDDMSFNDSDNYWEEI